jgi:hypothetical protein
VASDDRLQNVARYVGTRTADALIAALVSAAVAWTLQRVSERRAGRTS